MSRENTDNQPHTNRKRLVIVVSLLAIAVLLARPTLHLIRTTLADPHEIQPTPSGQVDDSSRLNATAVHEIWHIPVDTKLPEEQIAKLLKRARQENLKISIAGARHSMGGHSIYPGGIVLDTLHLNSLALDKDNKLLTAGAGALWRDIIPFLDRRGLSVAVMQSNNSFTVGGSISVNCHGWQYGRSPIASTVVSFRLMKADGSIVRCSRTENKELFSLALGGYGLFGVIIDVELQVIPNERYRLEQHLVSAVEALSTFDAQVRDRPDLQMVYARMNVVPATFLDEVIINAFFADTGEIPALKKPGIAGLKRAIFRGSADSDYGKQLRWRAETKIQPLLAGEHFSRNQLLNEGVEVFQNRSEENTDILHEYFVPRRHLAGFVETLREIIPRHKGDLLNVTIRSVDQDRDTFLRYATEPLIALVMLFVQDRTDAGDVRMANMTQELIESALQYEGRYYLPYRLHATKEQFHRAYPQARDFFARKREHDPGELFQNQFYQKYGKASAGPDTPRR